ncbi:response regulator [bacterium]|nr:response regulator [bacterium]
MPKLLIIEDQPALRETLCMALEQPDVKIRCAKDAEGGFLHALKWRPDVVITDYALPGMDGIELIKKIVMRKDKPLTPTPCVRSSGISPGARGSVGRRKPRIIMLSARMDDVLEQKALELGADRCMGKPFDLLILRMLVAELMRKNRTVDKTG